jgi:hypothetical protein
VIAVAAFSLAGCRGGGTSAAKPTTRETGAAAAVLKAGDLPDGWKPAKDPLAEERSWEALTLCLGVEAPIPGEALNIGEEARAQSPTFMRGPRTQVTSTVSYMAREQRAHQIAETFSSSQLAD